MLIVIYIKVVKHIINKGLPDIVRFPDCVQIRLCFFYRQFAFNSAVQKYKAGNPPVESTMHEYFPVMVLFHNIKKPVQVG